MKNLLKTFLLITSMFIIILSCDNDNNPSPNDDQCTYNGITFNDNYNNINTVISDDNLTTTFYPNANGQGVGRVEIRETNNPNDNFLITDVVTDGATGTGIFRYMGINYPQPITVTCQRAGTSVGDDFRLDVVAPALDQGQLEGGNVVVIANQFIEFEYCGKIDMVDETQYDCDNHGLYYSVNGGQEVFLPSSHDLINTNFTENNNSFLTIHQLGNGFFFRSSATNIGQTSDHDMDPTINGKSKLDIFSLWSNTSTVNITYTCQRNDAVLYGTVYYTFTGTFTDNQNNTNNIEGHLCVLLDEIRP